MRPNVVFIKLRTKVLFIEMYNINQKDNTSLNKNQFKSSNRFSVFFAFRFFPFSLFFFFFNYFLQSSLQLLACTYISKTVSSYVQPHVQVFRSALELSQLRRSNPFGQAGGGVIAENGSKNSSSLVCGPDLSSWTGSTWSS